MSPFSEKQVEQLARQYFGIDGVASPLPGEIDYNFLLKTDVGKIFTFKIAHDNECLENLDCQNKMLARVATKFPGLRLPTVLPGIGGTFVTVIQDETGKERYLRLLNWAPGRILANVSPHTPRLLESLGETIGQISLALQNFKHPAAHRFIKWDISQGSWIKEKLNVIQNPEKRKLARHFYQLFENEALPRLDFLRQSILYNDANDYNLLVGEDLENPEVVGVIDFGDFVFSHTINDLAIAIAYSIMGKPDPLSAAASVVRGIHPVFQLWEKEIEVLYYLVATRLLISVTCSAINLYEHPENRYLLISEAPAWDLLFKWREISPALAYYTFRHACGWEPCTKNHLFTRYNNFEAVSPVEFKNPCNLDLSAESLALGNNANFQTLESFDKTIRRMIEDLEAETGIGGYGEVRPFYTTDAYRVEGNNGPEWRTVHLGLDIWMPAGAPVMAPLDGIVHSFRNNAGERDYGPTIILEHKIQVDSETFEFFTLYGHLSRASLDDIKTGMHLEKGQTFAAIGGPPENGNWSPHLHFQVILDTLGKLGDFPGVAFPSHQGVWRSICPDPKLLLTGTVLSSFFKKNEKHGDEISLVEIISQRRQKLGKNLSVSYRKPLKIVRGFKQHLYDSEGRRYLDTVNNVAHVGHEHPAVVEAIQRQSAVLNTNTRYLHDNILRFADRLLATLPLPLEVVYVVNSGSEANELALRLARNFTGQHDIIVVEAGYHGNTGACLDISSYKFDGPGGKGAPPFVQVVPMPDTYRGNYKGNDPRNGAKYAAHVQQAVKKIQMSGRGIAAFICESILSCGGQIVLPDNYLKEAYHHVRSAGGVCIADEVQTGCGRVGSQFWAFGLQGVVPDIITIGKPIGNGHPLAVVVTTREIAEAFDNGMEYFNTFGGNPVSCAVGLEVLRIIKAEGLQEHAFETGSYLLNGLMELSGQFPIIGNARGQGLFLGYELVSNPERLTPAPMQASYLCNRLRELGILASTDGPLHNVIKIKPPMVFDRQDADSLLEMTAKVLKEDFMKV
jgi:4-aminobutyrate aminotransferase-like enzyme/Ser/Thr protein kinase RdoA (MazF antagonist)